MKKQELATGIILIFVSIATVFYSLISSLCESPARCELFFTTIGKSYCSSCYKLTMKNNIPLRTSWCALLTLAVGCSLGQLLAISWLPDMIAKANSCTGDIDKYVF